MDAENQCRDSDLRLEVDKAIEKNRVSHRDAGGSKKRGERSKKGEQPKKDYRGARQLQLPLYELVGPTDPIPLFRRLTSRQKLSTRDLRAIAQRYGPNFEGLFDNSVVRRYLSQLLEALCGMAEIMLEVFPAAGAKGSELTPVPELLGGADVGTEKSGLGSRAEAEKDQPSLGSMFSESGAGDSEDANPNAA